MNPMIWMGLFALLAIFFIVAAVLSARSWSTSVIVLAVALFIAHCTFFIYAALTAKTHRVWQSAAKKLQADIDQELAKQERLKNGGGDGAADEASADEGDEGESQVEFARGIRQVKAAIEFALRDRGRVWQGTGKWDAAKSTAEVVITEPNPPQLEPLKGEAADRKGTIVYAFESKDGGAFLGEFKVTAVDANKVTMEPTPTLSDSDKGRLVGKDGAWTIRANMPIDSHEAFAGFDSRAELEKVLPAKNPLLFANPDQDHAKLVDEYWKDQKPLAAGDTFERARVRLTMEKDVDGFDVGGGQKVDLKAGEEILVNKEVADGLIASQSAKEVEKIYDRWLRNYEDLLENARIRRERLTDVIAQIKVQRANVEAADADAKVRVESRKKEKEMAAADLAKLKFEQQAIKKHHDALTAQFKSFRDQMTAKFTETDRQMRELLKLQADAAKKIEGRTAAAR